MKTFKEWLVEEHAQELEEGLGKYLAPFLIGAGLTMGGGDAAAQTKYADPALANQANLTQQDAQQGHRFHPYSYRSDARGGMQKSPDYRAAYQNWQRHGRTGLSPQQEEIFQQMLRSGAFQR